MGGPSVRLFKDVCKDETALGREEESQPVQNLMRKGESRKTRAIAI